MSKTIYDLARDAIEAKQQWTAGETVTVWQGNIHKAEVREGGRDGGGLLFLVFRNGIPGQRALVKCGYLNPLEGWAFSLDDYQYSQWIKESTKILRGKVNGR